MENARARPGPSAGVRVPGADRRALGREPCELALAHVNRDRVEAAYRRNDLFEKRRAAPLV